MFFPETLLWLVENGWLMLLHLSAKSAFPKPLAPQEEKRLLEAYAQGSQEARETLIERNLRLVAHIAKKYAQSGVDTDDMISVGTIGLMKAVQTFRPEAGRLTTYASRCIENEMLMYLRANRKNRCMVLMGESIGEDKDGNEMQLAELLGTDEDLVADEVENSIESARAIRLMGRVLDEREIRVIQMRYGLDDGEPKPQHLVAQKLGISRSYVSRIEKKALGKLRSAMEDASYRG
ncbi:MAG: RNA polymerase sporulation sigma factor SigK [Christensenellales bacterium]|nr:RNA polymerase sporulation sigma factor SigK [Christensenellales bacterium]